MERPEHKKPRCTCDDPDQNPLDNACDCDWCRKLRCPVHGEKIWTKVFEQNMERPEHRGLRYTCDDPNCVICRRLNHTGHGQYRPGACIHVTGLDEYLKNLGPDSLYDTVKKIDRDLTWLIRCLTQGFKVSWFDPERGQGQGDTDPHPGKEGDKDPL